MLYKIHRLFGSPEESDEAVVGCKDGGGPANETGVKEEVVRVMRSLTPLTLRTVGNINAGWLTICLTLIRLRVIMYLI